MNLSTSAFPQSAAEHTAVPSGVPAVSVIVPIFNQAGYLEQALSSLAAQTLENLEFVCVNDGSTDASLEILQKHAAKDARFVILDKPNTGYGDSMNRGMEIARGEYIGIFEPDDLLLPKMYKTLYTIASSHDLDLVKADFYCFYSDADGTIHKEVKKLTDDARYYGRLINTSEDIKAFYLQMNTWSGIYKRDFLNRWNIRHNPSLGASYQDNGFWFQTFCRAKRAWFVDMPFYMYRQDNAASSIHDSSKFYAITQEYQFIYDWLCQDAQLLARFEPVFYYHKFANCISTYHRLDESLKDAYLQHIRQEFEQPMRQGKLLRGYFGDDYWRQLLCILKSPARFKQEGSQTLQDRIQARTFTGALAPLKHKIYTAFCLLRYGGWRTFMQRLTRKGNG